MAIRSADSRFFSNNKPGWLPAVVLCLALKLSGQLTTGVVEGILHDASGRAVSGAAIPIEGGAGFRETIHTGSLGRFTVILPYGTYRFSGVAVTVVPVEVTHIDLTTGAGGIVSAELPPGIWMDTSRARIYPEAFSLPAVLLSREPASVTEPLDFTGLSDNRLTVESRGGISWTETQFKLQGIDATDSYQPGRPAILPNMADIEDVAVRGGFSQSPSGNVGTEVGLFLAEPGTAWHAALSSTDTGSRLTSSNLPSSNAGSLLQNQDFRWLTRDGLEIGGPVGHLADVFASAWGQWGSQTVPLEPPGNNQGSRLLFANVRGRVRATRKDQFEALYVGSRIDLSNWGEPAGIEAAAGNRMAPSYVLPGGFPGQEEVDHTDFTQAAWTRIADESSRLGVVQIRYGYSTAHLDSALSGQGPVQPQSRIELLTGAVSGAPPLGNFAVRPRQSVLGTWQPRAFSTGPVHHRLAAGGGLEAAAPRNRFSTPSDMNLITANGVPAFVIDFNTPADTTYSIKTSSAWFTDRITLGGGLTADVGLLEEYSRGSVQGVPGALISWSSLSPRAGAAWNIPHSHGAALRAAFSRLYSPLAGRYLDYGDPTGLSGSEYQWTDANSNGWFDPGERGPLLMRFGGAYSSISPALKQPYSDHFDVGADAPIAPRTFAGMHLFRVDENRRIAALDVGVPAQDFSPVTVVDPGPDGIAGTSDDRSLIVYAQNPATLGQDRYLLTNPAGLAVRNIGFVAEVRTQWRQLTFHASFTAEKSHAPTNPGNAVYENDPGVLGSLLLDPNTAVNSANRIFVDRAYVGKMYGTYRLPWFGIEFASTAVYMDGLPFARELLVTGLPQGPFLVAATVRGSPEGGNRAEHVVNWNAGFRREFRSRAGLLTVKLDVMNVDNAGARIQESDVTGVSFNLRLPVALQSPRTVSPGFIWMF